MVFDDTRFLELSSVGALLCAKKINLWNSGEYAVDYRLKKGRWIEGSIYMNTNISHWLHGDQEKEEDELLIN